MYSAAARSWRDSISDFSMRWGPCSSALGTGNQYRQAEREGKTVPEACGSALRPCAGADPPPGRAALARARSAAGVVQALVELLHLRKLFESGIHAADLLEGLSRGRRISQTDGEVKEVGGGLPMIRVPALG